MKYKNKIQKIILIAFFAISVFSCSKKDFDINKNPDSVTDASASYAEILPASMQNTSYFFANATQTSTVTNFSFLQSYMGFWARSGDFQPVEEEEKYAFTSSFAPLTSMWNNLYANATNYNIVQNKAKVAGAAAYEGIARILKAQSFQMLVDLFGNVPYSQALQGTQISTPTYDKGIDIYNNLFSELDSAIVTLKSANAVASKNPNIENADLVYKGNTLSWIKFANTLKLRMLIHAYKVSSFDIAGKMAKINAEGSGFISAGQSAQINPGFTDTKPNPYYRTYVKSELGSVTGNIIRANDYAIKYYNYNGDPRINRVYVAPLSGVHKGIRYGAVVASGTGFGGQDLSTVNGSGYLPNGATSRAWILTSVESLFLQAEARERNIITTGATAKDRLRDAIRESFVWLGLTSAQADSYISNNATYPDVDYDGISQGPGLPVGGIYTILSQKWFALNGINALELWTDYRRTDFVIGAGAGFTPGPQISLLASPGTVLPVRLLYPQSEYNYNAENVAAQGVINKFTSKIFWDL